MSDELFNAELSETALAFDVLSVSDLGRRSFSVVEVTAEGDEISSALRFFFIN